MKEICSLCVTKLRSLRYRDATCSICRSRQIGGSNPYHECYGVPDMDSNGSVVNDRRGRSEPTLTEPAGETESLSRKGSPIGEPFLNGETDERNLFTLRDQARILVKTIVLNDVAPTAQMKCFAMMLRLRRK